MDNTIETKLNRVDTAVSTIKKNLHFEENALIEDVAASTDINRLTNVFVQQNEPAIKDGIWVQCDEKENAFDKIIMDRDMVVPYKWLQTQQSQQLNRNGNLMSVSGPMLRVVANGKVYFRDSWGISSYDLSSKDGKLTPVVSGFERITTQIGDSADIHGDTFYWFPCGYGNPYTWNINTGARKDMPSINYGIRGGCYDPITDTVYLIHDYGKSIEKYTENGWKEIYKGQANFVRMTAIGGKLWMFAEEEGASFVMDLVNNNTRTPLEGKADTSTGILKTNDALYLYNTKLTEVYKYNIDTLEREDVTALFQDNDISYITTMLYNDGTFYGLVNNHMIPMATTGKEYNDSAVLISQAPISRTEHQTALWTYDGLEGRMTQSFYDIFYYNKEKGYMKDYPIYYGNGTEWIKFKN